MEKLLRVNFSESNETKTSINGIINKVVEGIVLKITEKNVIGALDYRYKYGDLPIKTFLQDWADKESLIFSSFFHHAIIREFQKFEIICDTKLDVDFKKVDGYVFSFSLFFGLHLVERTKQMKLFFYIPDQENCFGCIATEVKSSSLCTIS